MILGTLSRLLDGIHKTHNMFLKVWILYIINMAIVLGLILGIISGIDAGNSFGQANASGQHIFHPGPLNKAGSSILITCYVTIVPVTALISIFKSHIRPGENRLYLVIILAIPFLLVRLVYTGFSTFSYNPKCNILDGNTTIFICMALIEELIVVIIFEAVGLTLGKQIKEEHFERVGQVDISNSSDTIRAKKKKTAGQIALGLANATIFGHLVMLFVKKDRGERDMEML